jgi:hypothetical protein
MTSNCIFQQQAPSKPANKATESVLRLWSHSNAWAYAIIFVVALAIRLWFNFGTNHVNNYTSCDAWEYLSNASLLGQFLDGLSKQSPEFFSACLSVLSSNTAGSNASILNAAFKPLSDFYISGPVFPAYLMLCFTAFGQSFDAGNFQQLLSIQSAISALTCVAIAGIGSLLWTRNVGILAGVIAAFYPGFIVNSGRLYPETFAAFVLSLIVLITVNGFVRRGNHVALTFCQGILLACLQLSRSAMVALSIVLLPITLLQERLRRPVLSLVALVFGFMLVALPWMGFQKLAFGSASLVVDRVGHYNFFVGNNAEIGGFLSTPYPDGHGIEKESFATLAERAINKNPQAWLKLMMDKGPRLFKFSWNDFRAAIGPISPWQQILFQQFILVLALCGITLACFEDPHKRQLSAGRLNGRIFVFGLLAFHLIYLFFITVPRYNLTAMPWLILFAAAGSQAMFTNIGKALTKLTPWLLPISALTFLIVAHANLIELFSSLPAFANGQDITACVIASSTVKALALIAFCAVLFKQARTLPAKAILSLVALFIFAPVCLPTRAHGRAWEWQQIIAKPGDEIVQTIDVTALFDNQHQQELKNLGTNQCYVLLDADGVGDLNDGIEVSVNGTVLHSPIIAGLSFIDNVSSYKLRQANTNENQIYLEMEDIYKGLSAAAGLSANGLRQWFLMPIPKSIIESGLATKQVTLNDVGKFKIILRKTNTSPSKIFGGYNTSKKDIRIPSIALYSWEKAFYGVENDQGLSDTRYDMNIANNSAEGNFVARSPFIRLLVSPAGALTKLWETDLIGTGTCGLPPSLRSQAKGLWLIQAHGFVSPGFASHASGSRASGAPKLELKVYCRGKDGKILTYTSPWAELRNDRHCTTEDFNFAVPINPQGLPGQIESIALTVSPNASSSLDNLHLDILQLPAIPTGVGSRVY